MEIFYHIWSRMCSRTSKCDILVGMKCLYVLKSFAFAMVGLLVASSALAEPKTAMSEAFALWENGEAGVNTYRIPALCLAPDGKTLVAACDARHASFRDLNAGEKIEIVLRTSVDGGKTWTPSTGSYAWQWDETERWAASDPSFIVDAKAKRIFLFYNVWENVKSKGLYKQYVQMSADNGKTWGKPREITESIRPNGWSPQGFVFITSGSGTQLADGTLVHTLVWVGKQVALFGSTDHGKTWRAIGRPTPSPGDECKVIELTNGDLMINSRRTAGSREIFVSSDRGANWKHRTDTSLLDPACNAQIMPYPMGRRAGRKLVDGRTCPKNVLLFSNCKATSRRNLTIRASWDDGETWTEGLTIEPGPTQYSDICLLPAPANAMPDIGILYEAGNQIRFRTVKAAAILASH